MMFVEPPVSLPLKSTVFAVPAATAGGAAGEVMDTTGAGVMVTVAVAESLDSSYEKAPTVTVPGEGGGDEGAV